MSTYGFVSNLRLRDDSPRRYIRVTIHESAEALQNAARGTDPWQDWLGALGCFQPAPHREEVAADGACIRSLDHYAGHLRVVLGTTPEIVAHEAVHAAAHIVRMDLWHAGSDDLNATLGDNCGPDEENYAHLVSGLMGAVWQIIDQMPKEGP